MGEQNSSIYYLQ